MKGKGRKPKQAEEVRQGCRSNPAWVGRAELGVAHGSVPQQAEMAVPSCITLLSNWMWHAQGKARPQRGQFAATTVDPEGADSWEVAAGHMSCGQLVSPSCRGIWIAHLQVYLHFTMVKLGPRENKHGQGYVYISDIRSA